MSDSFAQRPEVGRVELEGANQRPALGHAVAVRPPGDEQAVPLSELEVVGGCRRVMLGVEALDPVETGLDEGREERVGMADAGMREDGDSPRLVEEGDGVFGGDLRFGGPGWAIPFEESFEGLVDTRAHASLHEGASDVGPAWRAAVSQSDDVVDLEGDFQVVEATNHLVDAVLSRGLKAGQSLLQRGVIRVKAVAQEVQFSAGKLGGEFGAHDELDSGFAAGGFRASAAFDRVMVSEGERNELGVNGAIDQFFG
jgi:hypothetical protein